MVGNESLTLVDKALKAGNCGRAIRQMENYLAAWPEQHTAEKLMELREDYDRMEAYWQQGGADPQRAELYQRLLQRVYVLYANVMHYHRMKVSPYQNSLYTRVRQGQREWSLTAIRQEMEGFVSNVAMLQLEPDNKRAAKSATLYREHQQQMNQLFEYVLTSRQWSEGVGSQFAEMLTSPTTDSIDQQLLVSAVTLSLMNQFDMAKFRMLIEVYRLSQDEAVRQRALVGWALSVSDDYRLVYPEQRDLLVSLLESEQVCQELTELQMQLIYCLNEEKDSNTIQKEIMPDLLKSSSLMMGQEFAESDEDHLEEVLHPERSEERMEKMESSMRRMMDMQKEGIDVFYQGFSQIKRYPFFYDISNWLVPFFEQHPDIAQYANSQENMAFLKKVFATNTFCNSDKYSFVIAVQQVIDHLPQQVREMLKRGEYVPEELAEGVEPLAALERRLYLMDIYRFFRLFPHRSELYNPFDTTTDEVGGCDFFSCELLKDTPLEKSKAQIVRQLKKHQMNHAAQRLLTTFGASSRDVQYYLWTYDYDHVLQLNPLHERALLGKGRQLYDEGRYEEALMCFEKMAETYPEKSNSQLYVAICLVQLERYEDALKPLYRLNYEHPENDSVSRVLAWALTCQGKLEQAAKYYEQLTGREQQNDEDLKNFGYCLWLQGEVGRAADLFRLYCQRNEQATVMLSDFFDTEWLQKRGITMVEINMMQALL